VNSPTCFGFLLLSSLRRWAGARDRTLNTTVGTTLFSELFLRVPDAAVCPEGIFPRVSIFPLGRAL